MLTELDLYHHLGEHGFAAITRAFYARVPSDSILGPMYQRSLEQTGETMEQSEHKLRDFLIQRFGGPGRYSEQRGHPRLRIRHGRFVIDPAAAERWIALMNQSLTEANIDAPSRAILEPYFRDTAHHMVNR